MFKHTPGPWIVRTRPQARGFERAIVRADGVGGPVAIIYGNPGPRERNEATAILIARAPDMAEELERQKALIAIYERDRTRHLRSIEGADTDLAELGESLGEEIERLKAECRDLRSKLFATDDRLLAAEAQRDELLGTAEWVMDWLASFSMPPTSTIEEKQEAMDRLGKAIEEATP